MFNQFAPPRKTRRAVLISGLAAFASALLVLSSGCGGGGGGSSKNPNTGGSSTTVTGRVVDSTSGDTAVEGATVVIGGKSAITRTVDNASSATPSGSFVITDAPVGTDIATVTPPNGTAQTIRFAPPIASGANSPIELVINIGQISGRVLLAGGQPAVGAFVTVASTADSVTTGSDGRFFLPNVPAGATQLFVVLGTSSRTQAVTVTIGNTDIGDLTLVDDTSTTPPGIPNTIVGTVTLIDPSGTIPASSTTVFLFRNGVQIESTTTDASGNYGFYVPVGNAYSVSATRPGFQNTQSGTLSVTNPSIPLRADLALPAQ